MSAQTLFLVSYKETSLTDRSGNFHQPRWQQIKRLFPAHVKNEAVEVRAYESLEAAKKDAQYDADDNKILGPTDRQFIVVKAQLRAGKELSTEKNSYSIGPAETAEAYNVKPSDCEFQTAYLSHINPSLQDIEFPEEANTVRRNPPRRTSTQSQTSDRVQPVVIPNDVPPVPANNFFARLRNIQPAYLARAALVGVGAGLAFYAHVPSAVVNVLTSYGVQLPASLTVINSGIALGTGIIFGEVVRAGYGVVKSGFEKAKTWWNGTSTPTTTPSHQGSRMAAVLTLENTPPSITHGYRLRNRQSSLPASKAQLDAAATSPTPTRRSPRFH